MSEKIYHDTRKYIKKDGTIKEYQITYKKKIKHIGDDIKELKKQLRLLMNKMNKDQMISTIRHLQEAITNGALSDLPHAPRK